MDQNTDQSRMKKTIVTYFCLDLRIYHSIVIYVHGQRNVEST